MKRKQRKELLETLKYNYGKKKKTHTHTLKSQRKQKTKTRNLGRSVKKSSRKKIYKVKNIYSHKKPIGSNQEVPYPNNCSRDRENTV